MSLNRASWTLGFGVLVGCSTPASEVPTPPTAPSGDPAPPTAEAPPEEGAGKDFRMPGAVPNEADRAVQARAITLPPETIEKMRTACFSTTASREAATACQLLATLASEGLSGVAVDKDAATKLFERGDRHLYRACDAGDYESCASLGGMSALKLRTLDPAGASAREWAAAAIPLLDKACRGGIRRSCGDLADIYDVGRGVPRDAIEATAYRTKERGGSP